jgi:hypothetical protein
MSISSKSTVRTSDYQFREALTRVSGVAVPNATANAMLFSQEGRRKILEALSCIDAVKTVEQFKENDEGTPIPLKAGDADWVKPSADTESAAYEMLHLAFISPSNPSVFAEYESRSAAVTTPLQLFKLIESTYSFENLATGESKKSVYGEFYESKCRLFMTIHENKPLLFFQEGKWHNWTSDLPIVLLVQQLKIELGTIIAGEANGTVTELSTKARAIFTSSLSKFTTAFVEHGQISKLEFYGDLVKVLKKCDNFNGANSESIGPNEKKDDKHPAALPSILRVGNTWAMKKQRQDEVENPVVNPQVNAITPAGQQSRTECSTCYRWHCKFATTGGCSVVGLTAKQKATNIKHAKIFAAGGQPNPPIAPSGIPLGACPFFVCGKNGGTGKCNGQDEVCLHGKDHPQQFKGTVEWKPFKPNDRKKKQYEKYDKRPKKDESRSKPPFKDRKKLAALKRKR